MEDHPNSKSTFYLVLNCMILAFGMIAGPLVMRLYYIGGGRRVWFGSWLETGGWPVMFIPLIISYLHRRRSAAGGGGAKVVLMGRRMLAASTVLGLLTGFDDYMYAHGVRILPVSTSSILIATQLVFMAIFGFILVRQRFTAFSVNSVVLLTLGAVVLGMHSDTDRLAGVTGREYWVGFVMVLAAAVLYGFVLPAAELMFKKSKVNITYALVMETQMVMCFFSTLVCTLGMIINNDFQAIPREATAYKHGPAVYYIVVSCSALVWQCFFLGAVGVVHYSSSLLSGIIMAVSLPLTEVLAVIFYHEKFQPEKGLSLFLSLWGFTSYFWGEIQVNRKRNKNKPKNDTVKDPACSDDQPSISIVV